MITKVIGRHYGFIVKILRLEGVSSPSKYSLHEVAIFINNGSHSSSSNKNEYAKFVAN